MNETKERFKTILKTSIIGIIVNVILATSKVIIGTLAKSLAIMSDGVNNFADATSSLIAIIGAALAGKTPDRKHPYGHGRIEYLSSLIISGLVLYAGLIALVESVKAIFNPSTPDYSTLSLVIIAVAIVAKIALSIYTQKMGKKAHSDSLTASGKDAMMDALVSTTTIIAAVVYLVFHISVENYLAAIISIVIIKTGFELLMETVSKLLGDSGDIETKKAVMTTIKSIDQVNNAHDLVLYDYGPDTFLGSVHLDVDGNLTASELDTLTRTVTESVAANTGVFLAAVGFYARNTDDPEVIALREDMKAFVLTLEGVKGFHGFYLDKERKHASFDLVITLDIKNRREAFDNAMAAINTKYPDMTFSVGMDMDINEL